MTVIKVDGLPDGFELRKDYDGYKCILVYHDFDIIRKVAVWQGIPNKEDCLMAIERWWTR